MERLITTFFIITLLLLSIQSFSQARFGIRAGFNANNISSNYADSDIEPDTKLRAGFQFGLVANFELSESIDFQPGLLYTSKGTRIEDPSLTGDDFNKIILNYLELPLNVNYNFSEQVYGFAGPYLALGLSGKNKFEVSGQSGDLDYDFGSGERNASEIDNEFPIRALDFGINFGAGYMVTESVALSLGYQLGLSNINVDIVDDNNSGDGQNADDFKDFNRVLSLSLTYFLN